MQSNYSFSCGLERERRMCAFLPDCSANCSLREGAENLCHPQTSRNIQLNYQIHMEGVIFWEKVLSGQEKEEGKITNNMSASTIFP